MNNKSNYTRVVEILKADNKTLERAMQLSPEDANEFQEALDYNNAVIKASQSIIKAIDIVSEADKKTAANDKQASGKKRAAELKEKANNTPKDSTPAPEAEPAKAEVTTDIDINELFG